MNEKGLVSGWVKKCVAPLSALLLTGCVTTMEQQGRLGQAYQGKNEATEAEDLFKMSFFSPQILLSYGVWMLGLAVSIFIGHFVVQESMKEINRRVKIRPLNKPAGLSVKAGYIDRAIYTTFFALGQYVIVFLWFGIRIVQGIPSQTIISSWKVLKKEAAKAVNVHTLEGVLCLIFSILVALCIRYFLAKI